MMKILQIVLFFATITALAACSATVNVPTTVHDRLDADMNTRVVDMTDEQLRVHFNDLNNFLTVVQTQEHEAGGFDKMHYQQYQRVMSHRLEAVELELQRRHGI